MLALCWFYCIPFAKFLYFASAPILFVFALFMHKRGVSVARAIFANNSANAEGWALLGRAYQSMGKFAESRDAMKRAGKPLDYVVYPEEAHGFMIEAARFAALTFLDEKVLHVRSAA